MLLDIDHVEVKFMRVLGCHRLVKVQVGNDRRVQSELFLFIFLISCATSVATSLLVGLFHLLVSGFANLNVLSHLITVLKVLHWVFMVVVLHVELKVINTLSVLKVVEWLSGCYNVFVHHLFSLPQIFTV